MLGDTPLNVLFQQAANLKSEQLAADRRIYDSWSPWYRNSFFTNEVMMHLTPLFFFEDMNNIDF
jgi:hypothetical protein